MLSKGASSKILQSRRASKVPHQKSNIQFIQHQNCELGAFIFNPFQKSQPSQAYTTYGSYSAPKHIKSIRIKRLTIYANLRKMVRVIVKMLQLKGSISEKW